jgi:hypothetical protein
VGAFRDQWDNRMVDHLKNFDIAVLKYDSSLVS